MMQNGTRMKSHGAGENAIRRGRSVARIPRARERENTRDGDERIETWVRKLGVLGFPNAAVER